MNVVLGEVTSERLTRFAAEMWMSPDSAVALLLNSVSGWALERSRETRVRVIPDGYVPVGGKKERG